jgi:chitin disaccharide deacetylase
VNQKSGNQTRLIINADDFGLTKGVTDGIARGHRQGVVTSTSMMANQSASAYAAALLPELPELSVGVHLTLSEGRPVLPAGHVPTLVNASGEFYGQSEVTRRLSRWKFSTSEIESEFLAQIRWLKNLGVTLTHADSHHHMHIYPNSIGPYCAALRAEGITRSRAPRHWSWPAVGRIGGPHGGGTITRLMKSAYMEYVQRVTFRPFQLPDSCVTAHPMFQRNWSRIEEGWALTLQNLPAGTYELGCHPGLKDPDFFEADDLATRRELELRILTGPQISSTISDRKIKLIRYTDL